ncbi:MAG: S8 family peptidase [Chitinophagaceae bacterium]
MKRVLLFLFLTVFLESVIASPLPDAVKSFIVKFSQPQQYEVLQELTGFHFQEIEALNPEKTLYKFAFSSKVLDYNQASYIVNHLPFYEVHQDDGIIELRGSVPNDTLYSKQWHLPLIKANEAWDVTKSGVNRRGDTIVIAVIDDGLHIRHPDFQGSIWINYADSLRNGIDDDSNGFVDDTYGWNFLGRNSDISDSNYFKARHGTPVAGIIGARTNNVTGVSGIMWQVKLMIVNVTDTSPNMLRYQSDVLKAYSYVLHQRKLYNSSNGTKGAFVVATNSSWGIDKRFPHQAPLWCAFYDTLGKYGILNVSAASNAQTLIDSYGDLPSLCPSEQLIVVGNSTRYDNDGGGGYSVMHVDLSAPGTNVFSTANYVKSNILANNLFHDNYTGSSFSAPMVTAAIGVIHSYACDRLLDSIRINPGKGNLILRKIILSSVDPIDALAGKNATWGRLNILKALKVLNQYCTGEVSVKPISEQPFLALYPNPGNGSVVIQSAETLISVECYNSSGQLVHLIQESNNFQMPEAADGVYYFKVTTLAGLQVMKYVKLSE